MPHETLCFGCNRPAEPNRSLMEVSMSMDGDIVWVHAKSKANGWSKEPVTPCLRKAHERASRCPICGSPESSKLPCRECQEWIQKCRERDAREQGLSELKRVSLNASLLTHHVTDVMQGRELQVNLLEALAQTASVDGERKDPFKGEHIFPEAKHISRMTPTTGNFGLVTTVRQATALKQAVDLIYEIGNESYKKGFNDGRNVLMGLASGSLSLDEVNKQSAKVNKE